MLATLDRGPRVVGENRDAVGETRGQRLVELGTLDVDHVAHAGDLARFAVVERVERAVEKRATQHHRGQCAGEIRIDAETAAAGDDVARIGDARRLADDVELFGFLQRRRIGRRIDACGTSRERAVRQRASIRCDHLPGFGAEFLGRKIPFLRGGLHQQPACGRAGFAQFLPRIRNVRTAAGALIAVAVRWSLVGVDIAIRKLDHAHERPIDVELFGDQHRQRRHHTLTDLARTRADDDAVVALDPNERADFGEIVAEQFGRKLVVRRTRETHADQQRAGRRQRDGEKATAAGVDRRCHFFAACSASDARWIARRMRGYVPQRHRLLIVAMSSSLGLGLRCSRSTAAMIWPAWQ